MYVLIRSAANTICGCTLWSVYITGHDTQQHKCIFIKCKKVKQSRYRPEQAQSGSGGIALLFVVLGARRGCVVSITPRSLYPRERSGTHCTGGWVSLRARQDVCEKSRFHRDSIPGPSIP
jgi:hypothetical protein